MLSRALYPRLVVRSLLRLTVCAYYNRALACPVALPLPTEYVCVLVCVCLRGSRCWSTFAERLYVPMASGFSLTSGPSLPIVPTSWLGFVPTRVGLSVAGGGFSP